MRGTIQHFADTGFAFEPFFAGGYQPFFGAAALFARLGQFRQGGDSDPVCIALARFGDSQNIRRFTARLFGFRQSAHQRPALLVELIGRFEQFLDLLARLAFALAQSLDMLLRTRSPGVPGLPFRRDGADAAFARFVFAPGHH